VLDASQGSDALDLAAGSSLAGKRSSVQPLEVRA
jgi:hypothetical protein